MKKFIIIFLLAGVKAGYSQNSVKLTYDNAGNQIQRSIQVTNMRPSLPSQNSEKNKEKNVEEIKFLEMKIYPNPTNDFVNIEGVLPEGSVQALVLIRNNTGMLIKKDTYEGRLKSLNISNLASGIYYLEIQLDKKNSANYKIVITN